MSCQTSLTMRLHAYYLDRYVHETTLLRLFSSFSWATNQDGGERRYGTVGALETENRLPLRELVRTVVYM